MSYQQHRRPTNPEFDPSQVHANGSKIHGTIRCPHRCDVCSNGGHHWIECSLDPDCVSEDEDDGFDDVVRFDNANGTEHRLAFYSCKHCDAWAEHDAFDDDDEQEAGS